MPSAKKTVKRRKDHPYIPKKKRRRATEPRGAWYVAFRARVTAILDRTRAARREIDDFIGTTIVTSELPVVVFPNGRPKPPGLHRLLRAKEEPEPVFDPEDLPSRPPIAPPVPFQKNEIAVSRVKRAA